VSSPWLLSSSDMIATYVMVVWYRARVADDVYGGGVATWSCESL